jgi:DNA repair protein RadA/Sms
VSDGGRSQADTLTAGEGQAINRAQPLADVPLDDLPRMPTGLGEFDRVLGGGLVPGSVVLLGGDPGIGKSTLLLQALALLGGERSAPEAPRSVSGRPILYVSSEESARQVRLRAERLVGIHSEQPPDCAASPARGGLYILAETNLARIGEQIRRLRPAICAIDSIQMIHRPDVDAAAGSVSQVRRCCADLVYLAKRSGMPILVVGHVTKDGQLAGPKLLEHLVDVVLSFEGDRHHGHRIVRATKNRFGSTHEIGLFEMTGAGLRELTEGLAGPDPLRAPAVGTAVCPALLGSRCLLAEVEALTATGVLGNAKRKSSGLDASRLAMLIAVLEKHGGLRLADQDVFAAAAGGLRVTEPAADLALSLAIAGAHYRRALPPASVAIGEVGLPGRLRSVPQMHVRVREALRRGFRCIILPKVSLEEGMPPHPPGALVPVESVAEALAVLITPADSRREARGVPGPRSGGLHAT